MNIREDYIGNAHNGSVVHGLKRGNNTTLDYSFCGVFFPSIGVELLSNDERALQSGAVNCKSCRNILNLSFRSEKPDYYLIIDMADGIPEDVPPVVASTKNEEYLKVILGHEIDRVGYEYVKANYRIIGVKEVENVLIDITAKGYDIVLTKQ